MREQIFAVEMCMKIFGLGFRGYVADTFNIFDGTIVVVSFVEVPHPAINESIETHVPQKPVSLFKPFIEASNINARNRQGFYARI